LVIHSVTWTRAPRSTKTSTTRSWSTSTTARTREQPSSEQHNKSTHNNQTKKILETASWVAPPFNGVHRILLYYNVIVVMHPSCNIACISTVPLTGAGGRRGSTPKCSCCNMKCHCVRRRSYLFH
jgi:hypothetical protein